AMHILEELNMSPAEIAIVVSAIGNHEEEIGDPVNPVAAALILADKSDVHKTRVRNPQLITFDIHDRVNYAVERSFLRVDANKKSITLELNIDTKISQVMEYFEIFIARMIICRRAAKLLNCNFELLINEKKLL
ncbi:MAG: phosphohydrolase, partial [Elusimicrobiota bacterium]|nr:phosphohydrolase [Elusimicrobiota bacterium]